MTAVRMTTILRAKPGRLATTVRMCREAAEIAEGEGGSTRLFVALAAGQGAGQLISVTEWDSAEAYGRAMDSGPPQQVIEHIQAGDEAPAELVSMSLSRELPDDVGR